jgi:thioredoxin-related protein
VNGLKTELAGQLVVLVVDVQTGTGREISREYGSLGTPTFIYFDVDGEEVWRMVGSIDPERVRQSLP